MAARVKRFNFCFRHRWPCLLETARFVTPEYVKFLASINDCNTERVNRCVL